LFNRFLLSLGPDPLVDEDSVLAVDPELVSLLLLLELTRDEDSPDSDSSSEESSLEDDSGSGCQIGASQAHCKVSGCLRVQASNTSYLSHPTLHARKDCVMKNRIMPNCGIG